MSYKKQELPTLGEHLGSSEGAGGVLVTHLFSFRFLWCVALYFLPFLFVPFLLSLSSWMFLVSLDCPFLIFSYFFLSFLFAFSVFVPVYCVSGLSFLDIFLLFSFLLVCFLCLRACLLCLWIVLSWYFLPFFLMFTYICLAFGNDIRSKLIY